MLKISSIWISARMDTCERGISRTLKSGRTIANGFIGINMTFKVSLFSIGAEYSRVISVPPYKNMKD